MPYAPTTWKAMTSKHRLVSHGIFGATIVALMLSVMAPEAAASHRPYGPNAPWNVPVAKAARHPQSAFYSNKLYRASSPDGYWTLTFEDWTYAVRQLSDATEWYTLTIQHPTWSNLKNGSLFPWNPGWRVQGGTDRQTILLDPETGREWDLWQVTVDKARQRLTIGSGSLVPGSYWTKEDGFPPPRGSGIQTLAMLVRPQEIEQGRIPHALSMPIPNPNSSYFVPPATKLEGNGTPDGIPEGMRFALAITDAEIDAWVARLPAEVGDRGKRSARIIVKAMQEFGWFVTDTAGSVHLQFEDRVSAGTRWDALGLGRRAIAHKNWPQDMLDFNNLIQHHRIYAIVPSDQY
jgi:hypothetical protein